MTEGGKIEIDSVEEISGHEGPHSVLVPVVDGGESGELSRVEIGEDLSLTPTLAAELAEDLGLDRDELSERFTHTVGATTDDLVSEGTIEAGPSHRDDVWRVALSEDYELPSSLLRGQDRWQVTAIDHLTEGTARVSFGRLGRRELDATLAGQAADELQPGDSVVGPEKLWQGRGGKLGLGRASVEFVPDPDPPKPVPIWVPLMRLHRPYGEGCTATYSSESADVRNVNLAVKILGVGAEGGFKVGVSLLDEYVARSACIETVIPAKLQLLPGKTVVNGTEVAYGIRAKVTEIEPEKQKPRRVPAEEDDCERSAAELDGFEVKPYDERELPETNTHTRAIGVERETFGRLSVGLEMAGSIPIKLGMDYERSSQQKTILRIELAGGRRYLAYAPIRRTGAKLEQQIEICWTTKA
jgi:hypothetical protein